ncbi:hypothetical protein [Streptomyces sp. SID13588]|uniref:hypothetical protein n=1 Tax=Streptomyces sp. SID13588 TaxID=2706051 RepID=UPI0013CA2EC5|nr:hypothetical protein [Streptomyces sp. SID13588]NEA77221.1 hypothetical protein [Streptomyces sp. SID13588]
MEDDASPDVCGLVWVREAGYIKAWADARDAAEEMNLVLVSLGVGARELRAVAATDQAGFGLVRFKGSPDAVRKLASLLRNCDNSPPIPDAWW